MPTGRRPTGGRAATARSRYAGTRNHPTRPGPEPNSAAGLATGVMRTRGSGETPFGPRPDGRRGRRKTSRSSNDHKSHWARAAQGITLGKAIRLAKRGRGANSATQELEKPERADEEAPKDPLVNRNIALAVLVLGAFVIILNQTLLTTALPAFMRDFSVTANSAQWVTTIFMLVNGIMIPTTAFLIQKFTTRTLFLSAMGLFSAGTIVCAMAPTFIVLLAGRVIQASGGGIIIPLMQTILFAIFPRHKRGTAMGTFGLVIAFAPAIGPSLSGWIVDSYPWQTLFLMMLPISVIAMIIGYFILANVTDRTFPRLDILSIIMSSIAFGGLLYGFSAGGNTGWTNLGVVLSLSIGAVVLVLVVWRQLRLDDPLLEFRVLKNPMFTLNTVLGMCVFIAMIGGMIMIPLYMQNMSDYSAMEIGRASCRERV